MQYATIGRTGIEVSRFALGCMGFGVVTETSFHKWTLPYDDSKAIIKSALDAGITFFDTAIGYQGGTSEQFVGQALRELAPRDSYVVATKFPSRPQPLIDQGMSGKEYVRRMLDTSLKNLGLDTIDLYYLHMWDYHTPIAEIMEALNEAVVAGKVRALGISNCHPYQLAKANALDDM